MLNYINKDLSSIDPIRLGTALSHSVYHYDIFKDVQKACQIAKFAFDEAL